MVEEKGDVDGNHRHHVNDVQRVTEELLPVGRQKQTRHHLTRQERYSVSNIPMLLTTSSYMCTMASCWFAHLKGEPAGAEHLEGLHGGVFQQVTFTVKSLRITEECCFLAD